MKNPTKAEKLKWTREAANKIASGKECFSCNAFEWVSERGAIWYKAILRRHYNQPLDLSWKIFGFTDREPDVTISRNRRLIWLCFLITLIEHGEPSLTDV